MTTTNAEIITVLADIIAKLAAGEMDALNAEVEVDYSTNVVEFYPIGEQPIRRKVVPTITTLSLRLAKKKSK